MKFSAGCCGQRLAVLVIVTSWLTGCATAGFEQDSGAVCPPVVNYSRAEQARAADEIAMLPDNAVIVGWLADYAVLRDQARACTV